MKVLAVDPGYDRLGVAVIKKIDNQDTLLYSSCIETQKTESLAERLFDMGKQFEMLLTEHQPDLVGIENLFFNKNVKTAIGVAQARGIIMYLAMQSKCRVYEFGPQEIKIAVTGYGKSDKGAVIDMVKRLLPNVPENALDDEYDAIAVGITTLAHHR